MTGTDTTLRRPPKQDRSRCRVEEILAAAKRLIGEKGIDAVKMREIAALAGGPISSVYQYFPNKSAIIAVLYAQWSEEMEARIASSVTGTESLDDLKMAASDLVDYYFSRIEADPAILDLVNAIQADKTLKNIDIESTKRQAASFSEAARPFIPALSYESFCRVTFLMFQMANGAVRLALCEGPDNARGVLNDYKTIIRGQLSLFVMPKEVE